MTVEELLERISSKELSEWMAFYKISPWDQWRDDWRFAMLAATMANINRGKKGKKFTPDDFIAIWHKRPKTQEEMDETMMRIAGQWPQ